MPLIRFQVRSVAKSLSLTQAVFTATERSFIVLLNRKKSTMQTNVLTSVYEISLSQNQSRRHFDIFFCLEVRLSALTPECIERTIVAMPMTSIVFIPYYGAFFLLNRNTKPILS